MVVMDSLIRFITLSDGWFSACKVTVLSEQSSVPRLPIAIPNFSSPGPQVCTRGDFLQGMQVGTGEIHLFIYVRTDGADSDVEVCQKLSDCFF